VAKKSSSSIRSKVSRFKCPNLKPDHQMKDGVSDRQEKVDGFDQEALTELSILLIGAGGLGTEIGEGLVRKGVGTLIICDGDKVELSNLNRQKFYEKDLYTNKATSLARNLKDEGAMGTNLIAYEKRFQELKDALENMDLLICAVDNNPTRRDAAKFCIKKEIPGIFTGVSEKANHGYVFVQEVGGVCWGCALPNAAEDEKAPCPGTPAVKDVLKLMGSVVLYSADSLFMDRPRTWNFRDIYLSDPEFDYSGEVKPRDNCSVCGGG